MLTVHSQRHAIKSSNKKEHCFITWTLVVLFSLTLETHASSLPVCSDSRGVIARTATSLLGFSKILGITCQQCKIDIRQNA